MTDSCQTHAIISTCPVHIGGWSEDGRSLIVRDVDAFTRTVVPSAFKHSNWASFVRQLNYYGFKKVRVSASAPEECEFRHELFQRGRPELVAQIRRPEPSPSQVHRPSHDEAADELRQDLDELRAQVDGLSSVIRELCGTILKLSEGPTRRLSPAEAPSSSCMASEDAAHKRQKTEDAIDFEMLESLFEDDEDVTAASRLPATSLSAIPSTVTPMAPLPYPILTTAYPSAYSISGC